MSAGLAVGAAAIGLYRRRLGRRADRYARISRLGVGTRFSFFEAVAGEPPALRRRVTKDAYRVVTEDDLEFDGSLADPHDGFYEILEPATYVESIFVDRDYYVQTVSSLEETVLAFSVTTRRRGFKPRFQVPPAPGLGGRIRWRREAGEPFKPFFKVRLGRTTFAELDAGDPDAFAPPHFKAVIGARVARYAELAYFGNPGHYLHYVFSANVAWENRSPWHLLPRLIEEAGYNEWPYPNRPDPHELDPPSDRSRQPDWDELKTAHEFRRRAVITTFTAIHPDLWPDNYPVTFGPHGDEVRLVP